MYVTSSSPTSLKGWVCKTNTNLYNCNDPLYKNSSYIWLDIHDPTRIIAHIPNVIILTDFIV